MQYYQGYIHPGTENSKKNRITKHSLLKQAFTTVRVSLIVVIEFEEMLIRCTAQAFASHDLTADRIQTRFIGILHRSSIWWGKKVAICLPSSRPGYIATLRLGVSMFAWGS